VGPGFQARLLPYGSMQGDFAEIKAAKLEQLLSRLQNPK
jgi:hypothetical protein